MIVKNHQRTYLFTDNAGGKKTCLTTATRFTELPINVMLELGAGLLAKPNVLGNEQYLGEKIKSHFDGIRTAVEIVPPGCHGSFNAQTGSTKFFTSNFRLVFPVYR